MWFLILSVYLLMSLRSWPGCREGVGSPELGVIPANPPQKSRIMTWGSDNSFLSYKTIVGKTGSWEFILDFFDGSGS